MKKYTNFITACLAGLLFIATQLQAQEKSRYMGGEVELVTAPNGAIVNAEVLKISPLITYLEPTIDKVAEGVWCIGGYSLANCTVIETEDGLIMYDTGDTKEEAEHIREAIKTISNSGSRAYFNCTYNIAFWYFFA